MMTQIELDRFGRVLIPKKLREHLGLQVGEALEVEVQGDHLILRPSVRSATLLEHQGRLVLDAPGNLSGDVVDEARAARLTEVLPLW